MADEGKCATTAQNKCAAASETMPIKNFTQQFKTNTPMEMCCILKKTCCRNPKKKVHEQMSKYVANTEVMWRSKTHKSWKQMQQKTHCMSSRHNRSSPGLKGSGTAWFSTWPDLLLFYQKHSFVCSLSLIIVSAFELPSFLKRQQVYYRLFALVGHRIIFFFF